MKLLNAALVSWMKGRKVCSAASPNLLVFLSSALTLLGSLIHSDQLWNSLDSLSPDSSPSVTFKNKNSCRFPAHRKGCFVLLIDIKAGNEGKSL